MKTITHAYCEICGISEVIVESMDGVSTCGEYLGGDIVCKKCKLVIVTIFRKNPPKSEENQNSIDNKAMSAISLIRKLAMNAGYGGGIAFSCKEVLDGLEKRHQ